MQRWLLMLLVVGGSSLSAASNDRAHMKVRVSWGHEMPKAAAYQVSVTPGNGAVIDSAVGVNLETGESYQSNVWMTRAGAGDIDGVQLNVSWDPTLVQPRDQLQRIWSDLISASDADTARRLTTDPAFWVNPPKLTIRMHGDDAQGFSVALTQLALEKAIWVPSLGVYLTAGDQPVSFEQHQQELQKWKGHRVLDTLRREPEATYEQYASLWENMGSPAYMHPAQMGPGHIVGLSWDSAIPKFGIDRGSGVWSDYGNPDKFQFWFDFGDLNSGLARYWKGQRLQDGLPVIRTTLEKEQIRYEVEQFAYPLNGPPSERRGDIPMVLMEQVKLVNLTAQPRKLVLTLHQRRQFGRSEITQLRVERRGEKKLFRENGHGGTMFEVDGSCDVLGAPFSVDDVRENRREKATDIFLAIEIPANGTRELVVKLPSPVVESNQVDTLVALNYPESRAATLKFWSDYIDRSAQFRVPDEAVNTLYRASLWHALRLPRRHGGAGKNVRIDLPFSNFAYDQTGTPWPVNQAIYVDYMLYSLRGYNSVSLEELLAQYRNNQEESGRVGGFARWGVYTPSMLYASAQYYLLSGDRDGFEQLLPPSLKALDWCLNQIKERRRADGTPIKGLLYAPLNDLTGEGEWAFNQAYLYAGLELFGQALAKYGNNRASATLEAAVQTRTAINQVFQSATVDSTLVELRDHTWVPYVPSNAEMPRRLMDIWYPTDVDTGAVHLLRLKAMDSRGNLADSLLNDQEDNLFYKGWGSANEPVYAQHADAYLLRDDVKPLIRAFYSLMASGFSQNVFEPVEHRWTWGQFFGSPCTDGAWFEIYRNMLVHETDDGSLELGLGVPRAWLEDGKQIEVSRAPTYFGPVSFEVNSHAAAGHITATVKLTESTHPRALLVRLRHPENKRLKSVTVNGKVWSNFDPAKEWVMVPNPEPGLYTIEAGY